MTRQFSTATIRRTDRQTDTQAHALSSDYTYTASLIAPDRKSLNQTRVKIRAALTLDSQAHGRIKTHCKTLINTSQRSNKSAACSFVSSFSHSGKETSRLISCSGFYLPPFFSGFTLRLH